MKEKKSKEKKLIEKWIKIYDELIILTKRKIDHHKSKLREYEKQLKEQEIEKENFIKQYKSTGC